MENKVVVKNLQVNYKTFGEGKPFLILHGWGSNSDRWQKIGELLLAKNFKVIIPDLPGFGKSQQPKEAWNLDSYVEWVSEFSKKLPDLNKNFYLLGHSFGGAVSAKFSIKYNQNVDKLFLLSAACIRKNTILNKILYRIAKIIKILSFLPYYSQFRKIIYKFIIRKSDYSNQEGIMKEIYLRIISEDLSHKLSFIKNTTVIIWGDKDELTPIEYAYFINKRIQGSKLIIVHNIGHDLDRHQNPEILAQKILDNT